MIMFNELLKQKIHFCFINGKLLSPGLWYGNAVIIDEGLMYLFICPVPWEELQ